MKRHAKGLFCFAGFYTFTNWYGVVVGGSPVTYFFLPWNDYQSYFDALGLAILFSVIFILVAILDEKITMTLLGKIK